MSSLTYILKSQNGQFLAKNKTDWLDQDQAKLFFTSEWYDDALNTLIEICVKDSEQRITVEKAAYDQDRRLIIANEHQSDNPRPLDD